MLWHNLATGKQFFDDFLSVENGRLFHLTYITWVRLCYMMAVCCKVVFCNIEQQSASREDGNCDVANEMSFSQEHHHQPYQSFWDCLSAARTADFQRMGGSIEDKVRSVRIETGNDAGQGDAMARFAQCLKHITSSYERRIQHMTSENRENGGLTTTRMDSSTWNTSSSTQPPISQLKVNDGTSFTSDLAWNSPMDLQTDSIEDIVWESLLRDFTVIPQQ